MESLTLSFVRFLFGTIEHFAPSVAGRVAFYLFCRTPNPEKVSAKERAAIKAAEPFMAQAKRHFLASHEGQTIVAHEFAPASRGMRTPIALVVHGWRSRADHMRNVIGSLQANGFRVVAVDLPGHGQSSGRRLHMRDAVAALHAVARKFGPFEVIVGHSFGGAVAINAVCGSISGIEPVRAERLALISAPSSIPGIFRRFGDMLGLGTRSYRALCERIERIAGRPLDAFVGANQLAEAGLPALVVHAPDDKEVPVREARAYAASGANVKLYLAEGLGHRRILADRDVLAQTVNFALGERRLALVG